LLRRLARIGLFAAAVALLRDFLISRNEAALAKQASSKS
jgi:hypothetical protein